MNAWRAKPKGRLRGGYYNQGLTPSRDVIQLTLTLKMTTTPVVETSVTINNNPIQDYVHPDDHTQPTYEKFKLTSKLLILNLTRLAVKCILMKWYLLSLQCTPVKSPSHLHTYPPGKLMQTELSPQKELRHSSISVEDKKEHWVRFI